jgi:DNA-directed RNA polymerase beta subunit
MTRSVVDTLLGLGGGADAKRRQGGYFVINGSEKVLIAQERMAANRVYVFAKAQPSPITYLAEIRSAVEKGGKTISSMQVKMMRRNERQVRPRLFGPPRGFLTEPPYILCRAAKPSKLPSLTFETIFQS